MVMITGSVLVVRAGGTNWREALPLASGSRALPGCLCVASWWGVRPPCDYKKSGSAVGTPRAKNSSMYCSPHTALQLYLQCAVQYSSCIAAAATVLQHFQPPLLTMGLLTSIGFA